MDIMQYSNAPTFQGIQPVSQQTGSYNFSVEEIAFSMRQHLFDPTSSTTVPPPASGGSLLYHLQGRPRPIQYHGTGPNLSDDDIDDTNPCLDGEIHQLYQNETYMKRPMQNFHKQHPSTNEESSIQQIPTTMVNGHSPSHRYHQQQQVSNQPDEFQDGQLNHSVSPDLNYPRLKSKFYEDLRQKYPKAFKNHSNTDSPVTAAEKMSPSTVESEEDDQKKHKDISPRYLPRPPNESPRTLTRNTRNLREAARLLLNQNRQNLSVSVSDGEKTNKESPDSVKDRLRQNKERMKELLQSPGFGKYKDKRRDSTWSPSEKIKPVNGVHKEFSSAENLKNSSSIKSGLEYVSDSGIDATGHSTSRSMDSCQSGGPRDVGSFQLRRHASGGCLIESRNGQNTEAVNRGYHTADSDTDSGISRSDHSWHGSHRRDSSHRKQLVAPSREALRVLQKKRESYGSQNGSAKKSVTGPMKADHNIQPYTRPDDSPKENHVDFQWLEQGARPKHSSSTESLTMESESVRHEFFYDTPIRNDGNSNPPSGNNESFHTDNESISDISDYSNPAYRGRLNGKSKSNSKRTPSPCRSVRFEDTDSDGYQPRSRSSSHNGSILKEPGEPKRRAPSLDSLPQRHSSCNTYSNPVCEINDEIDSRTLVQKKKGSSQTGGHSSLCRQSSDDPAHYSGNSSLKGRENTPKNYNKSFSFDSGTPSRGRKNSRSSSRNETTSRESLSRISAKPPPEPLYAKVDKSRRQRSSSQPPERRLTPSRQMVGVDSWSISSNPCINDVFDDGLLDACESSWDQDSWIGSDLSRQSNWSSSRTSLASRASISEKMSSLGRATKKKFSSMRRALSLDRIDKASTVEEPSKMRKSPSLRSLTSSLGKKFKRSASSSDISLSRERSGSIMSFSSTSTYTRPRRSTLETDVTRPTHLRKVGRLLQLNKDGTQVIELVKPPSGPFGFYIAKGKCNSEAGVFVTRLSDGHPEKILLGLIHVGDEILEINEVPVQGKSIDDVYDIILENDRLVIKILPLSARS